VRRRDARFSIPDRSGHLLRAAGLRVNPPAQGRLGGL